MQLTTVTTGPTFGLADGTVRPTTGTSRPPTGTTAVTGGHEGRRTPPAPRDGGQRLVWRWGRLHGGGCGGVEVWLRLAHRQAGGHVYKATHFAVTSTTLQRTFVETHFLLSAATGFAWKKERIINPFSHEFRFSYIYFFFVIEPNLE